MQTQSRIRCFVLVLLLAANLVGVVICTSGTEAAQVAPNQATPPKEVPAQVPQILQLDLIPPQGPSIVGKHSPGPGIRLINPASMPVEIGYGYWPYIHLSYRIMNERGELLHEAFFFSLASVSGEPHALRIEARDSWSSTLHLSPFLLADSEGKRFAPGKYLVQGVFRYRGFEARSNVIEMALVAL